MGWGSELRYGRGTELGFGRTWSRWTWRLHLFFNPLISNWSSPPSTSTLSLHPPPSFIPSPSLLTLLLPKLGCKDIGMRRSECVTWQRLDFFLELTCFYFLIIFSWIQMINFISPLNQWNLDYLKQNYWAKPRRTLWRGGGEVEFQEGRKENSFMISAKNPLPLTTFLFCPFSPCLQFLLKIFVFFPSPPPPL